MNVINFYHLQALIVTVMLIIPFFHLYMIESILDVKDRYYMWPEFYMTLVFNLTLLTLIWWAPVWMMR